jgi:2-dehydropantoate 2-reductase
MLENPVIAIIGAGALGSYYGARLAQHGHNVHFLMRSEYAAIREKGMTVKSCHGDFAIPADKINVHNDPAKMPKADLAIITIKSTANAALPGMIGPILKDDTILLTLQNGLGNEDLLARHFGRERVLGGVAFVCINRTDPGVVDHTAHGNIKIGELTPAEKPTPRLSRISEMFNASKVKCETLNNLMQGRWEKLLWNIPFNGLSTALDRTTDKLLETPLGIELVRHVMNDVYTAAKADGITIPPDLAEFHIQRTLLMGAYFTSSHVDRLNNRPLELEALFGRPLKIAQQAGAETPWLEMMCSQLHIVDPGKTPTPA